MTRIVTARLVLEPVTPANAVVLWRVMQSPHLREFQDIPRHTRDEFARRVASRPKKLDARTPGRFEWLVCVAEPRTAIGWISVRVGERPGGSAELGYSVLEAFRGQGYAAEAVRAIVDDVFATSGLRQLEACCVPANAASRKVLSRAGFAEVRLQPHGAMVKGRPVDIVCFELPRTTWSAQQQTSESCKSSLV